MGRFNIRVLEASKTMTVKVEGIFSPEDGKASIEAYHQYVSEIHAPDYTLDLDCRKLGVSAPESLPHLSHCFELYKDDNFRNIIFRIEENPILKMQLASLARSAGLAHYEFVEVSPSKENVPI
jgi:hypothetical protein